MVSAWNDQKAKIAEVQNGQVKIGVDSGDDDDDDDEYEDDDEEHDDADDYDDDDDDDDGRREMTGLKVLSLAGGR